MTSAVGPTVRAKFKCGSKKQFDGASVEYEFNAVYSTDPTHENKFFWDATPNASLKMTINNRQAQVFEPGKEYYLDFTEAPKSNP